MNKDEVFRLLKAIRNLLQMAAATDKANWWETIWYLDRAMEAVAYIQRQPTHHYENWDMSKELLSYQSGLIFPPSHLHGKVLKQWYRGQMLKLHGTYMLPEDWLNRVGIPVRKETL